MPRKRAWHSPTWRATRAARSTSPRPIGNNGDIPRFLANGDGPETLKRQRMDQRAWARREGAAKPEALNAHCLEVIPSFRACDGLPSFQAQTERARSFR